MDRLGDHASLETSDPLTLGRSWWLVVDSASDLRSSSAGLAIIRCRSASSSRVLGPKGVPIQNKASWTAATVGLVIRRRLGLLTRGTRRTMNRPSASRKRSTGYHRLTVRFMPTSWLARGGGVLSAPAVGTRYRVRRGSQSIPHTSISRPPDVR
jgi:hypothetical protein